MTANRINRYLFSILSLLTILRSTPAWSYSSNLDPSLGRGGIAREDFTQDAGTTRGEAFAFDAQGRLLVVGNTCSADFGVCSLYVARFAEGGAIASSTDDPFGWYGVAGLVMSGALPVTTTEGFAFATSMAIDPQGRIVVAGYLKKKSPLSFTVNPYLSVEDPSASKMIVARFTPNGWPDLTFGDRGLVKIDVAPGNLERAEAVAIDTDGTIVVAGWSYGTSKDVTLVRLRPSGGLESYFGNMNAVVNGVPSVRGVQHFGSSGRAEDATSMVIDRYGRIVVAGKSEGEGMLVVRFMGDGRPDLLFGPNADWRYNDGRVVIQEQDWSPGAEEVAIDSFGRIVAVGTRYADHWDSLLARIEPNGAGFQKRRVIGHRLTAMAIDSQNRIVTAGYEDNFRFADPFADGPGAVVMRFGADLSEPRLDSCGFIPLYICDSSVAYNDQDTVGSVDGLYAAVHSVSLWRDVAVDGRGRVVVVGYQERGNIDHPEGELVIARYYGQPFQSYSAGITCPTCAEAPPGVCGNGFHEFGEFCDDGNTASGDACSSTCEVETDFDADGLLDAPFDYCVDVSGTQGFVSDAPSSVSISRSVKRGSETLNLFGTIQMPSGWRFEDFDPTQPDRYSGGFGVDLAVVNGVPSRVMASVVVDDGPDRAWTHPMGTSWRYTNRIPDEGSPIVGMEIWDAGEGRVGVRAQVRKSTFRGAIGTGFDPMPLQAWVTLGRRMGAGQHGECGQSTFVPTDCTLDPRGMRVSCSR